MLLLLFVAGVVFIFLAAGKSEASTKKLSTAERNLKSALALSPAPTDANLAASVENIEALKSTLSQQIAATEGRNPAILESRPPLSSTDMYYDLLAYKNELDKDAKLITPFNAAEPGVAIPEDFNWGFSRFLASGEGEPPPEENISDVFTQKIILNYLLRKLLATGPQSMVSVKREPVVIERPAGAVDARGSSEALEADEFWIGSETASIKGAVETMAFEIGFTGYTQNLRAFLKDIASFELPLVVRSVEVKPVDDSTKVASNNDTDSIFAIFGDIGGDQDTEEQTAAIEENQEPVVDQNISQFSVVVEYIEVKIDA
ncbi:hypothetical protein [Rubellicoccus peritrichatus]|uniref:hypothetical protein n=1 Tax=Rubellicoccus peritrichatus TaxID=3080537 RepID=UPI0031F31709